MREIVEQLKNRLYTHFDNEVQLTKDILEFDLNEGELKYLIREMMKHPHAINARHSLSNPNRIQGIFNKLEEVASENEGIIESKHSH